MRRISRRQFIEDSIFASAALAATSSQLWGPQTSFSQDKRISANERLGVAVVGCGSRGGSHINEFLADSRAQIVFLCDADMQRAKQAADNIEKNAGYRPKIVADMREAISDPSVDIPLARPLRRLGDAGWQARLY